MGSQQLLLIVLGVIIVGIAVVVGLSLFQSKSADATVDTMVQEMMSIMTDAQQYRQKTTNTGGGGGSFLGFTAASNKLNTQTATYTVALRRQNREIRITGTSKGRLSSARQTIRVRIDATYSNFTTRILRK